MPKTNVLPWLAVARLQHCCYEPQTCSCLASMREPGGLPYAYLMPLPPLLLLPLLLSLLQGH